MKIQCIRDPIREYRVRCTLEEPRAEPQKTTETHPLTKGEHYY